MVPPTDKVGFLRQINKRFYLVDANGDGQWNGPAGGDILTLPWGWVTPDDIPVIGRW